MAREHDDADLYEAAQAFLRAHDAVEREGFDDIAADMWARRHALVANNTPGCDADDWQIDDALDDARLAEQQRKMRETAAATNAKLKSDMELAAAAILGRDA